MRIALVHDWLTGMRGGEKLVAYFCRMFPRADLLTMFHKPRSCWDEIERRRIITSELDDLPFSHRYYRLLLPLMPLAAERLNLQAYDLVLSSSTCVAKGVHPRRGAVHVCYCNTPMRYVWSQRTSYESTMGLAGRLLGAAGGFLRAWDLRTTGQVTRFIADSRNIAERIRRTYGRDSDVVHPAADTDFYTPADVAREDFYLVVSALAPYKHVEHAVEAAGALGRTLKVIGTGQQAKALARGAAACVEFLGWQDDAVLRDHYRRCRALLMPGEEDFGIVPVEAMACGAPVIAYGAGGATETVVDAGFDGRGQPNPTGLLYPRQTVECLMQAIETFEQMPDRFDPTAAVAWAAGFGIERFQRQVREVLERELHKTGRTLPP